MLKSIYYKIKKGSRDAQLPLFVLLNML